MVKKENGTSSPPEVHSSVRKDLNGSLSDSSDSFPVTSKQSNGINKSH